MEIIRCEYQKSASASACLAQKSRVQIAYAIAGYIGINPIIVATLSDYWADVFCMYLYLLIPK